MHVVQKAYRYAKTSHNTITEVPRPQIEQGRSSPNGRTKINTYACKLEVSHRVHAKILKGKSSLVSDGTEVLFVTGRLA